MPIDGQEKPERPRGIAFAVPPLLLEILDGDIVDETTDAIVNAANNEFWMGAGVAGAIKSRGGSDIEREAIAQGPVEPGDCVMTSGGRLAARYVIHAAVMQRHGLTRIISTDQHFDHIEGLTRLDPLTLYDARDASEGE